MESRLTAETFEQLNTPFDPELVSWKPQATSKDGGRALAVAYVDVRAYQDRLNEVLGGDWSDDYEVINGGAVVLCRLTVGGVTRADIGESDPNDQNTATSAIAQAFKRACVKFGLGAYLYRLPKTWAEYDPQRRRFTDQTLAQLQKLAGNGNGRGPGLCYADGSQVSGNGAEREAYEAHVKAVGKPPANVAELRTWAKQAA